jgi:predicted CopG family antitoxin
MSFTTITMKRETYLKLLKVKAEMQMEKATSSVSFTDVIEELIKIREMAKRMRETIIDDLEYVLDLIEAYNDGRGTLAEIWDYVKARIEAYQEQK